MRDRGGLSIFAGVGISLLMHANVGCDGVAPQPAIACEFDRDCADGDLCNGLERCQDGVCAAGVEVVCGADAMCLPAGGCIATQVAAPASATARCAPPSLPAVAFVSTDTLLPIHSARPSDPVELAIGGHDGVLGPWQRIASSPIDIRSLLSATTTTSQELPTVSLGVRFATPPAGCAQAAVVRTYMVLKASETERETMTASALARLDDARHTRRIVATDPRILGWAADWVAYSPGARVDAVWTDPALALGPSQFDVYDVLSLGEGGSVTLALPWVVADGPGPDLAVFENAVPDDFVELAFVEVASDGVHFARFDAISLTPMPVGSYDRLDGRLVDGLAGPAPLGVGVAFDLADLAHHPAVLDGRVDLAAIAFVRVVDIIGDGSANDSLGLSIFDPYPVMGSAGFDLESIAVLQP